MHRSLDEAIEHNRLVYLMALHFKKLGHQKVRADLKKWEKPDPIYSPNSYKRFIPDITCSYQDTFIILEAETCTTLNKAETREQFAVFRAHADMISGRFEVVVPKICKSSGKIEMQNIARGWNIHLDNIWIPW
jgi:hypothetical protein